MTADQTRSVMIDIHHHFNPAGKDNDGSAWSIEMALDQMDENGITAAIASLGPVSDWTNPDRPSRVRAWNEWGSKTCLDHPGRFGLFASLPLPHIDLALAEIAYAFDVLKVDGIAMSTNEGDLWLSDDRNRPIFDELNRRKAVIFVHPAPTSQCGALSRAYGGPDVSSPWLEFPVNSARAILGLLAKGITRSHPDIRFIFCHGGGVMPLLLGRIAGFSGWKTVGPAKLTELFPDGIYAEFQKFYFDCGQAYAPETMALLQRIVPTSHLLFGTDFSYFPISHSIAELAALDLTPDDRAAIAGGNAATLFPRFSQASAVSNKERAHI